MCTLVHGSGAVALLDGEEVGGEVRQARLVEELDKLGGLRVGGHSALEALWGGMRVRAESGCSCRGRRDRYPRVESHGVVLIK